MLKNNTFAAVTAFSERSEPSFFHSDRCITLPAHPATVLFTKKKEPDVTVKPIKVTIITAYGLLHNTTNTIMRCVAFPPLPFRKSRSTLKTSDHLTQKSCIQGKERNDYWKKNLCWDYLRQTNSTFSAIHHLLLEAVVNAWLHLRQHASKF